MTHSTESAHAKLPPHCGWCGADWPDGHHGICRTCSSGLPCRADTTDTVAPDPPCPGSRSRARNDGSVSDTEAR